MQQNPYWVEIEVTALGSTHVSSNRVVSLPLKDVACIEQSDLKIQFAGPFFTEQAAEYYLQHAIVSETTAGGSPQLVHAGLTKTLAQYMQFDEVTVSYETEIAFHWARYLQQFDLTKGRGLFTALKSQHHWLGHSVFKHPIRMVLERMNEQREYDELVEILLPVLEILSLIFHDNSVSVVFGEITQISLYATRYAERLTAS